MIEPATAIDSLYGKFLECGAVCTDSRRIVPGSIFFALRGDSFDGNRFVLAALESGAAYAVADDPDMARHAPENLAARITTVGDSLTALQQLAARHRAELGLPVLAITGTNGKTTTKELLARVMAKKFRISVTQGNLNNHIGVPLTLLAMTTQTEFGIVEMGASAVGDIALLCLIAQPDYGIITNIGLGHLEGFGGIEGVKKGKGELYDYLAANGGVAFLREDDATLVAMARERQALHTVPYTQSLGDMPSHMEGDYNRYNIAAAASIGEYFEIPREDIMQAVAGYEPDNTRSQIVLTARNRLVVDCYNANPSSMRAAIENLARSQDAGHPAKAAILGDMLELGEWSAAQHEEILQLVLNSGIDEVYLVGENFAAAAEKAGTQLKPMVFKDAPELAAYLASHPFTLSSILIKGSRGICLETVLKEL